MDSQVLTQEQNIPQPPVPAAEEKNKDWFKILLIVVGFLVSFGLFGNVYLLLRKKSQNPPAQITPIPTQTVFLPTSTPTQTTVSSTPALDLTANWKTYKDEALGFEFKCPREWPYVKGKIYSGDINSGVIDKVHFGTDIPDADNNPEEVIVFFAAYKNSSMFGSNPQQYFEKIQESVDLSTKQEVSIDGLRGLTFYTKGVTPFSHTTVFGKNGVLFRFELLESKKTKENREENIKIFDQILSTFKFIESTANWKTYTDKKIIESSGLYLKLPSEWIIKYRKTNRLSQDYNANFRIEFDFSPPGWKAPLQSEDWMGWRTMNIDVYGTKTDINQWMTDYLPKYKNGLTVSETKTIGNKTAYLISASPNSEFFVGWMPRYVILGKDYSYELGFNNNGVIDSDKIIEKDVYPGIYFN